MKAAHSGRAVAASPKLWMVSSRSATLPVNPTITNWTTAVTSSTAKEILVARIPRPLAKISPSTAPWEWAWLT
ncbi:MAG: hypothetical protein VX572_00350 [Chloroflexota bacterium]|nr:hypothetical protein [Chloroflexota bacterium]